MVSIALANCHLVLHSFTVVPSLFLSLSWTVISGISRFRAITILVAFPNSTPARSGACLPSTPTCGPTPINCNILMTWLIVTAILKNTFAASFKALQYTYSGIPFRQSSTALCHNIYRCKIFHPLLFSFFLFFLIVLPALNHMFWNKLSMLPMSSIRSPLQSLFWGIFVRPNYHFWASNIWSHYLCTPSVLLKPL